MDGTGGDVVTRIIDCSLDDRSLVVVESISLSLSLFSSFEFQCGTCGSSTIYKVTLLQSV